MYGTQLGGQVLAQPAPFYQQPESPPKPEPLANVLSQAHGQLCELQGLMDTMESRLFGIAQAQAPGVEKSTAPQSVIAAAFDIRTHALTLHKRMADMLSRLV